MPSNLNLLLNFVSFTHDIRNIKRAMWVKDEDQYENDSEHGYQLALIALFIINSRKLNLNVERCMAIAIVHDVIEVYAGDTPAFGSTKLLETKQHRELEARTKLKADYPELNFMHTLIDEYEDRQTSESKFVYALDKVLPIFNNYLDNGRNWKKDNITLDDHVATKADKVSIDSEIQQYYEEIMDLLAKHPELFPQ